MESSRRNQAREDLGLTTEEEQQEIDESIHKEEIRRQKKELARQKLENETSYKLVKNVAFIMDKCFADAIIGFFAPGAGDVITSAVTIPYLYVSLFKIKSIPLTLAIIYNMMLDCFIGIIPYVGDIFDIFHRSYQKSYQLIVGYVEDDEEIIKDVRRRSTWCAIMIVVLGVLCYLLYQLVSSMVIGIQNLIGCN
ncbi:MAG: DUF4112 domain-containing protein [Bacteroidales bacterium]|nr:DUF4112 domain-containing protein [Bacteroidales bacterium]